MIRILIILVSLNVCFCQPQQPVIGILTQDTDDPYSQGQFSTYIAASYVKYIEMAGGQVVPIFYHSTKQQLDNLLPKLNGVLFPGGGMLIDVNHPWTSNTKYIFQYANQQNNAGKPYPIWSTCLGFQTLMFLTSDSDDKFRILTRVQGQDGRICPQKIYSNDSLMLKSLNEAEFSALTTGQGIMYYHHHWSVNIKTYQQQIIMNSFWKLISTSRTPGGDEFVSMVEAINYPYFGTQYHPQKNSFEWRVNALKNSVAISAAQHLIKPFMNVARKNTNWFTGQELKKRLIYNYNRVLTQLDYEFVELYLFNEGKIQK